MPKATAITSKTETGKVNQDLLSDYASSIDQYEGLRAETISQTVAIEIEYMRASVASGLSVRDQVATLKAGQEQAKAKDLKVLPDLGVGKVQVWATALTMYDTVEGAQDMDFKTLLNLAWNSTRLDKDFTLEGKTVEQVASAIPAREVKGNPDKPKTERKGSTRAIPTLSQLVEIVEQVKESLPEDLTTLTETDIVAVAKLAQVFASLSRAIKKAA